MGQVIRSWPDLALALDAVRAEGKRIVSTNGVFDVLHVGHVRYLKAAKRLGDCLVIGVNSDECTHKLKGPKKPFVPEDERMELLASLQCVDYVTVFDEPTPIALLTVVRPDFHAKGGDYHPDLMPETETVRKYGGDVVTLPFEQGHSTTSLTEKIAQTLADGG